MRTTSIRRRLMMLACLPLAAALLLIAVGVLAYEYVTSRASHVQSLEATSRLIAANCRGVLAFEDKEGGTTLLSALEQTPAVHSARLFGQDGSPLADYFAPDAGSDDTPPASVTFTGQRSSGLSEIELMSPIRDGGEVTGHLYVRASLHEAWTDTVTFVGVISGLMAGAAAGSVILARRLQQRIAGPLESLTHAAARITDEHDFSIRVESQGDTELRQLQQAFNGLLAHVEASDNALQESHRTLEQRVAERTAQLSDEIDTRRLIQLDLEKARDAAEAASQAKSEFLANMSHEIRTPMTAILGFADLLMEDGDLFKAPPRRIEALRTIQRNGEHLLSIINDILDLSKIEAGKMTVERIDTSPVQLISEVYSLMQVRAVGKELSLDVSWKGLVPASIKSDPTRLRQILVNLVSNAIKFTEAGGVRIGVGLEYDEFHQPRLRFDIEDSGIGMSEEQVKSLFGAFSQADTSMTRRFGGTGLGLAISQRLAKILGGEISAKSTLGVGSTFTLIVGTGSLENVRLIDAQASAAQEASGESELAAQDTTLQGPDALKGIRILLVEDGPDNQRLISLLLRRAGAEVEIRENGRLAVEAFTTDGRLESPLADPQPYDIVLMDMQMPEMDGYTAAGILRAMGNRVPIVALTAHALRSEREKCIAAGCHDYMTKPVNRQDLIRSVRRWVDSHRRTLSPATV